MTDLGTFGGTDSSGDAINDSGQVTGGAGTTGNAGHHAFLYSNGSMTDLGTLGGATSDGNAINASGQVVGYAATANNVSDAFIYSNGSMVNLNNEIAPGSGFTLFDADGINNAGDIYGQGYYNGNSTDFGYLLTPVAVPEPASLSLLALCTFPLLRRNRKSSARFDRDLLS